MSYARQAFFLKVVCEPRYWEDGMINGEVDEFGNLVPFKKDDTWEILIDLQSGMIKDWPAGTIANIHYKVCDAGEYFWYDGNMELLHHQSGYVPSIIGEHGDYMVLDIEADGHIKNWLPQAFDFMPEHDQ